VGEFGGIELRRGVKLQGGLTRGGNIAVDGSVKVPVFVERIAGLSGTISDKGFEDGTLSVIEEPRPGNVLAGGIGGEFILEANGIANVESGLGGVEGDFEVNVRRVGGEGLLMLRLEAIPR